MPVTAAKCICEYLPMTGNYIGDIPGNNMLKLISVHSAMKKKKETFSLLCVLHSGVNAILYLYIFDLT